MDTTKLKAAKKLAKWHFDAEPNLKHVYLVESPKEDDPNEPIKLLEIVHGAIERGIEPISFPANAGLGIRFRSVIIELSPREFKGLRSNTLHFPDNSWVVGNELT